MTVLLLLLIIALSFVVATIGSLRWLYILLKPYLQSDQDKKLVIKGALIFIVITLFAMALVWYIQKEPDYFEQGMHQLHESKYIKGRIDGFSSYSFEENTLTKEPKSPATFQVQINGDSLTLYLTCTMLQKKNKWLLYNIKEDSVKRTPR
jgi:hypothetical protein